LHSLQKTVLYRDIKSTNVLLNKDHTLAKLANCSGLKEWQDGTMTVGVGSGLWMAPEVMTGDQYDDKADVFSFGILLSELDTYLLPYADFTTADTGDVDSQLALTTTTVLLHRVLAGQATVTFSKDLRADVRALGEACVRLDPKQRPTSAQVLYELQKIERTMESEISIVL
jgi:serine/threonine-protein kinase TNNI3K